MKILTGLGVFLAFVVAADADTKDFRTVSAAASKKFDTDDGYEYAIKFEDWISNAATDVMSACASNPRTELTCDIAFIVGGDGKIQRILFGSANRYQKCVSKHFHVSGRAPRPPAGNWPMQIRVTDGSLVAKGNMRFVIFSQDENVERYRPIRRRYP